VGVGCALQEQTVLAVRTLDVRRVFLEVDLTRIFDVAQLLSGGIFDVDMRRLGRLRLPGRQ
jgi:hypothetical protein